jgi:DNA-binding response OmpR family regulator
VAEHRLLILDDETAIAELAECVAADCGFETRLAFDTDMFWEAYDEVQPTHILLDLNVPGVHNSELVHALADRGCMATVMLTSGSDVEALALIEEIGRKRGLTMAAGIAKPFRLRDLRARLAALIGNEGL